MSTIPCATAHYPPVTNCIPDSTVFYAYLQLKARIRTQSLSATYCSSVACEFISLAKLVLFLLNMQFCKFRPGKRAVLNQKRPETWTLFPKLTKCQVKWRKKLPIWVLAGFLSSLGLFERFISNDKHRELDREEQVKKKDKSSNQLPFQTGIFLCLLQCDLFDKFRFSEIPTNEISYCTSLSHLPVTILRMLSQPAHLW